MSSWRKPTALPFRLPLYIGSALLLFAAPSLRATACSTGQSPSSLSGWTTRLALSQAVHGQAGGALNGLVYTAGGRDSSQNLTHTTRAYNPGTNGWNTLADLSTQRYDLGGSAAVGFFYAVGGYDSSDNPLSTVESYDPVADHWTGRANLPTACGRMGVASINNLLYVVGGDNSGPHSQ